MRTSLPVLSATQLTCEKQDRVLFQGIDLLVQSGELLLLKGENGAGKTSLLRILVGLSSPACGHVSINNHSVSDEINLASNKVVYVGHKLGMSSILNPIENLRFWCELQGLNVSVEAINEVLLDLGLAGLEDLPVKHLSAGQQRRVALAKLWLHKDANLWVLDEPFTALDVNLVEQLESHISQFLDRQGAVIMTSHQALRLQARARVFELEYAW